MFRIDKSRIAKFDSHEEAEWDGFVENVSPEEGFMMVWELTKKSFTLQAAKEGLDEPEFLSTGLQRHIIAFEEIRR